MRATTFLTLAALFLLPAPVGAADEVDRTAAAFDRSMGRMDGYLETRSFEKGLRELGKLLEDHGEQPYVRARRAEIEDYARRFAFGARYPEPTAAGVLRGRVESYDPDSGRLKVEYTPSEAGDFQPLSNGTHQFFADTMGPFTLEVIADHMPSSTGGQAWMEFFGGLDPKTEKPQIWHVYFGSPDKLVGAKTVYRPAIIQFIDGDRRRTVSTSHDIPGEVGDPYVAQINVGHTSIQAAMNHKIVGKARKQRGQWGWIRFAVPGWTKLKFNGYIEPAYVQARLDAVRQTQLAEFRKGFQREQHLPAWLFRRRANPAPFSRPDLPVELDKKHVAAVRALQSEMRAGDWTAAREHLAKLGSQGLPAPVLKYFSAQLSIEEGDPARGLLDIDEVMKASPEFVEGMLLRGRILGLMRRGDDAAGIFQRSIALQESDPAVYEAAVVSMLLAGRPDAAQKFIERAATNQIDSPGLDTLAQTVVKAQKGPSWSRVYDYQTRNYHVFSDISKGTCVKAAKLLEDALTCYRVNFRWVSHDKSAAFPVYLFSGKWGFDRYIADLQAIYGNPHRQMLGMYSPLTKQLLIWNQPDQAGMFQTVRHEGFHQYLDSFAADLPRWLNEGLAVYHEVMTRKDGRLVKGAVHEDACEVIQSAPWVPLSEFIFEPPSAFYGRGYPSYAQAWLLVHMLMEGTGRWRELRQDIVDDLGTVATSELLAKYFTPEVVEEMDAAARAYKGTVARKR